jgi:hypothetical protein
MTSAYFKETLPRDLIQALREYPKGRDCQRVYDDVLRAKNGRGERTLENFKSRKSFESAVRATFNLYNKNGKEWTKNGAKPENALFFCPQGLHKGVWAVDLKVAEAWLAESPFKGRVILADEPSDVTF